MEVHKPDATSADPAALSIRSTVELSNFARRVTCILASRYVERDAIFKLRYQAYLRAGLVSENSFGRHIEPADHVANAYLMRLYVDRRLVSSLRLQIGSAATPYFSSLELFPHLLEPIRRSGKTIIDMSCVATDGVLARQYVLMPYRYSQTVRAAVRTGALWISYFPLNSILPKEFPPHFSRGL